TRLRTCPSSSRFKGLRTARAWWAPGPSPPSLRIALSTFTTGPWTSPARYRRKPTARRTALCCFHRCSPWAYSSRNAILSVSGPLRDSVRRILVANRLSALDLSRPALDALIQRHVEQAHPLFPAEVQVL